MCVGGGGGGGKSVPDSTLHKSTSLSKFNYTNPHIASLVTCIASSVPPDPRTFCFNLNLLKSRKISRFEL